ncbi:FAD-dependent oxidoreductase [Streptomyces sp. NPDC008343]|uniref:FAD-dependent oxidoreductase n=1 Tax=Streptomyces sp. NPDC008343 TaxID=3364828 RepID=UPI0036EB5B9D
MVGVGYAGGTVARELGARGMKILVLEARGRLGGRIEPGTLAGEHIDLGGGWFGPGRLRRRPTATEGSASTRSCWRRPALQPPYATGLPGLPPAETRWRHLRLYATGAGTLRVRLARSPAPTTPTPCASPTRPDSPSRWPTP